MGLGTRTYCLLSSRSMVRIHQGASPLKASSALASQRRQAPLAGAFSCPADPLGPVSQSMRRCLVSNLRPNRPLPDHRTGGRHLTQPVFCIVPKASMALWRSIRRWGIGAWCRSRTDGCGCRRSADDSHRRTTGAKKSAGMFSGLLRIRFGGDTSTLGASARGGHRHP